MSYAVAIAKETVVALYHLDFLVASFVDGIFIPSLRVRFDEAMEIASQEVQLTLELAVFCLHEFPSTRSHTKPSVAVCG